MKSSTNKLVLLVLVLSIAGVLVALMREEGRNPIFRAADYANIEECIRSIPGEWLQGSLEYDGAEAACIHEHAPRRPGGR